MTKHDRNVLTIGYARQALIPSSREHERFKRYARELDQLAVIVFTRRDHGHAEPVRDGNLVVYPTNSRTRLGMLLDAVRIGRSLIKSTQAKAWVVSAQDPFETSLVAKWVMWGTPAVLHVQLHGDNFGSPAWRRESLLNQVRYRFGLMVLRSAHRIRVVSQRIKNTLITLEVPQARITVLPIRPEIERFLSHPHTVGSHNPFIFLAASRFSPEKNIPLIIRAFAEVAREFPHTRLRLVGKGVEEATIRSCIAEFGLASRVDIISWTEAIELEMQNADVFLLASNHEAYGLTLVEAMAAGLPIVTTDVGCVGELVVPDTHALVVPIGDEVTYAEAMKRLVRDEQLRKTISHQGKLLASILAKQTTEEYTQAWVAALFGSREAV